MCVHPIMPRARFVLTLLLVTSLSAYCAEVLPAQPDAIPDAFSPLARFKHKTAAEWLAVLQTRDEPARLKLSLDALAEVLPLPQGNETAVEELLAVLKETKDADTLRLALRALAKIGPDAKAAEPPLLLLLAAQRESALVRAAACRALIQIAPTSGNVRSAVIAAASDASADVRRDAFDALIVLAMAEKYNDVPAQLEPQPVIKSEPGRSKQTPRTPSAAPALPLPLETLAKAALMSRDAKDAASALQALGTLGVEPLVRALQNGSPLARAAAADALGHMQNSAQRALPALLQAARKEPDRRARDAALFAAAALNSHDPAVLELVADNLAARPDPLAPFHARTPDDILFDAGKDALPALRKSLRSDSVAARFTALKTLVRHVAPDPSDANKLVRSQMPLIPISLDDCLPDIAARLRDKDDDVRVLAVQTLNRLGPAASNSRDALLKAAAPIDKGTESKITQISSIEFQRAATLAVLNVSRGPGDAPCVSPLDSLPEERLIALLSSASAFERADAALALRVHRNSAVVPVELLKSLNDPDVKVQRSAARALGAFGAVAAPAIPTLTYWLSAEPRSQICAVEVLADLGTVAASASNALAKSAAEDAWPDDAAFEKALIRALRPHADTVLPALIGYLRSGSPAVRARSAKALGLLGPTASGALADLLELAQSSNENEARAAFEAIRAIGPEKDPSAISFLSGVIRSSLFASRRRWAVAALGMSRPGLDAETPERTDALIAALSDSDDSVCQSARDALIHIGEPAVPLLIDALSRNSSSGQFWMLMTLAGMKADPITVVPRLFAFTLPGVPSTKRVAAIDALGTFFATTPGVESALLRALKSDETVVVQAAQRALLPIAQSVRPALERMLLDRDPVARKHAAEILETIR